MINAAANDPLPYAPIRIVDISPYRSSLRSRPTTAARRRLRSRAAALLVGVVAIAAVTAGVVAAPNQPGPGDDFRLAPGNGMPLSLQGGDTDVAADAEDGAFRLGPGHAMPPSIGR
jgi:hypothetical protein